MNKIVLFAPGVVPPWTEGRKVFVKDLADELRARGVSVQLLNGASASSRGSVILDALRHLRAVCNDRSHVDVVAAFPYGTFHGFRGKVNAWLLHRSQAICSNAGIPHIAVFYSCVGLEVNQLGSRFAPALAVGRQGSSIDAMHLGIRHPSTTWCSAGNGLGRVLFLCGYQKATLRALHDVLHERGLADLLDAGNAMADENVQLTVAVPFLRNAGMAGRLRREIAQRCPRLDVELQGEVDPYELFRSHDAFVFPYRSRHSVFVPTSLLEAMAFGIPVIAADHLMYRSLTVAKGGARCGLHRVGDATDLGNALHALHGGYDAAIEKAYVVSKEVRTEWTVEHAVDELLAKISSTVR